MSEALAVVVRGVSKAYELWDSPRERLMFPLRRVLRSLLPESLRQRLWLDTTSGHHTFHALHDVSFGIRRGESWGFIGLNGSGKSTLLRIIAGNLRPSSGDVAVSGKVAILDYGSGFNTDFTGRENIYLKGALLGLSRRQIDERLPAIIEFADIGEFIDQPAKTYSSGMTARLGFAIMAHVDAEILITDEALAVGDAFFVQKCMRHIRGFLKNGTFLFVSHSTNDVMSLCDHAVWLEKGRIVKIGKAGEVCLAYQAAVERRNSEGYLSAGESVPEVAADAEPVPLRAVKRLHVTREQLAILKHHFAPRAQVPAREGQAAGQIDVRDGVQHADVLLSEAAVGGGRIFSVGLTDEAGRGLGSVIGGETVCLTVRALAERSVERPILGFQLKNPMGLTLVAENTCCVMREQEMAMQPGEVIGAHFVFALPLLPIGEYVIRAGFADGSEDDNALLDVKHEALLLRCETTGARHGLVGVPMLAIDIVREPAPRLDEVAAAAAAG